MPPAAIRDQLVSEHGEQFAENEEGVNRDAGGQQARQRRHEVAGGVEDAGLLQGGEHQQQKGQARVHGGGHEDGGQDGGMPAFLRNFQTEDPGGYAMHQDGAGQRETGGDGDGTLVVFGHEHQVADVDNQVAGDNAHVPQQGRSGVGAGCKAPYPLHAAQVDEYEHAGRANAHGGKDDGRQRHLLEFGDVEHAGRGGNDQAAGGQSHEEHEVGDIEAP